MPLSEEEIVDGLGVHDETWAWLRMQEGYIVGYAEPHAHVIVRFKLVDDKVLTHWPDQPETWIHTMSKAKWFDRRDYRYYVVRQ